MTHCLCLDVPSCRAATTNSRLCCRQVQAMCADVASAQDSSLGMLAGLADQQQALAERLEVGLAQLRKEMKPSQQQVGWRARMSVPGVRSLSLLHCSRPVLQA